MFTFTYQPALRPALPCVYGPLDYREQRALFERIDLILSRSGLEQEFINLALADRQINSEKASAKFLGRFARMSVLALRSNIARKLIGLGHRDFCARLADSPLLQWFLHVGEIDAVTTFAKSSSDRFGKWVSEQSVRTINEKFNALLAAADSNVIGEQIPSAVFGLPQSVSFDDVYFDSTCLKADIHFPIDWVLLRDAARTLMKATTLIRKHGLKNRMGQEPLEFPSDMNTLCMKMTAKGKASDEGLQEVVRLDDAAEVKFLEPPGVETGEQHVVNEEDVDFPLLEVLHPRLALILGAHIVKDQGVGFNCAIRTRGEAKRNHVIGDLQILRCGL